MDVELHDEIVDWMDSLGDGEWDRTLVVIDRLATLRKQRNNERTEIARARTVAEDCAGRNP